MAFGTAEHATTRGCLRGLSRYVGRGDRVADVGAGSGILSIAAVLLGADQVVALELDPTSCRVAEENVTNNGVRDRVEIRHEPARPGIPIPGGPFQGIVANLQSGIILPLLPLFRSGLAPGGWLIASGILLEELDQILRTLMKGGWYLLEGEEEGEWWTGVLSPEAPGG
jgi:ribosomal protein L11 methyltransferase